jgi:RNA polymerase sigma-70 factor (ECF subfamily)
MDTDPDLQLVKLCQSGDNSAFEVLVTRHKDRIYKLIYRMIGDAGEVDDIAQDVFLKVYQKLNKFECRSRFSTWITKITVNQCINYLRSRRRAKLFSTALLRRKTLWVKPDSTIQRDEKCKKVYEAINSLPPKQKAVIVLHYFEDRSCEEIADVLGSSVGTVKSRLFHGRKKLKKLLEPYITNAEGIDIGLEIGGEGYEMFKM